MTGPSCTRCHGTGYIEAADQSVDACKACAHRAEVEWRTARPARKPPVLRVVPKKEQAA